MKKLKQIIKSLLPLCKWFANNTVGLVGIPITVLAIIVSLYTDVFRTETDEIKASYNYFQMRTYFALFERQKGISTADSLLPLKKIEGIKDTVKKYTHIVYIDRTHSTNLRENEEKFSAFKTRIKQDISAGGEDKLHLKTDNINSLKECLLAYFLQQLLLEQDDSSCNTRRLYVRFFDGNKCSPHEFVLEDNVVNVPEDNYIDLGRIEKRTFRKHLKNLLECSFLTKQSTVSTQKSNFDVLFKDMQNRCKEEGSETNYIITIISDFEHDDITNISVEELEKSISSYFSKKNSIIRQYNLIAFPTANNSLLNTIKNHIYNYDNIIKIDVDKFGNDAINNNSTIWENFVFQYDAAFHSISDKGSSIKFYHPRRNPRNVEFAKAKISFNKCKKWRLVTHEGKNKAVYKYFVGDRNNSTNTVNGTEYNICDTTKVTLIHIEKPLQHIDDMEYRLEVVTTDKKIEYYPIEFSGYMKNQVPDLAITLLWILVIILIICCVFVTIYLIAKNAKIIRKIWDKKKEICSYLTNKKSWRNLLKEQYFLILLIWVLFVVLFILFQIGVFDTCLAN
jgi:hypothetical protein